MGNSRFYTIFIVSIIASSTNSDERWYSTDIEDKTRTIENHYGYQRKFEPVAILNHTKYKNTENHATVTEIEFKLSDATISANKNNIHDNTNSTKLRPKRKIVRNCPTSKLQHNTKRLKNRTNRTVDDSRFLEIFEVIEFDHVPCITSNGLEGTCLHVFDCQQAGGTLMGNCADGFGACCVVTFSCDSRTAAPVGWFTNPEFPSPNSERISCTVTIDKSSPDVKQIRLDFKIFEMLPPTSGTCEQDQFIITGQEINNVIPILCGINSGQHVYIEVGNVEGPIYLSIQSVTAENRLFSFKVTQLTPSHDLSAPTGCLQYYKEAEGVLESFNYKDRSEVISGISPSYLNNLNYAMCIERRPDACSITYTNDGVMQIVNYDNDGIPVIPRRQAGAEVFNCPTDWLLISAVRLCGERLNDGTVEQDFSLDAPVTDDGNGPIVVWFRSDSVYTGRGFKLQYHQNSCSPSS